MLAPGGSLILSVEAWPGALLTDSTGLSLADLTGVLQERVLAEENERWVRVVDASDQGAILRGAGLEVVQVAGTHFVPDGPLMSLLDVAKLGEERYTEEVVRLEALLRDDEALGAIPRALLGVAVKPHGESAPCA